MTYCTTVKTLSKICVFILNIIPTSRKTKLSCSILYSSFVKLTSHICLNCYIVHLPSLLSHTWQWYIGVGWCGKSQDLTWAAKFSYLIPSPRWPRWVCCWCCCLTILTAPSYRCFDLWNCSSVCTVSTIHVYSIHNTCVQYPQYMCTVSTIHVYTVSTIHMYSIHNTCVCSIHNTCVQYPQYLTASSTFFLSS